MSLERVDSRFVTRSGGSEVPSLFVTLVFQPVVSEVPSTRPLAKSVEVERKRGDK